MAGEKLTLRMRQQAYWSMLRQDQEWFDMPKHKVSYLTTLLSKGASLVQGASMLRMAFLLEGIFAVLLAIAISFAYSWHVRKASGYESQLDAAYQNLAVAPVSFTRLQLLTPDFASVHVGASAADVGSHDPDADQSAHKGGDTGRKGRTSRH